MTSTDVKIGIASANRPSSRVLKPPGGGHSNIFAEPEVSVNAPRPKYNQQNSSNLNACMGSTDPNQAIEKLRDEIEHSKQVPTAEEQTKTTANAAQAPSANATTNGNNDNDNGASARGRVPPGGFSSGGFW